MQTQSCAKLQIRSAKLEISKPRRKHTCFEMSNFASAISNLAQLCVNFAQLCVNFAQLCVCIFQLCVCASQLCLFVHPHFPPLRGPGGAGAAWPGPVTACPCGIVLQLSITGPDGSELHKVAAKLADVPWWCECPVQLKKRGDPRRGLRPHPRDADRFLILMCKRGPRLRPPPPLHNVARSRGVSPPTLCRGGGGDEPERVGLTRPTHDLGPHGPGRP